MTQAWLMSLSGSELARITREGDDLVLAFAVAQVRPVAAPRFGQGDATAYLAGVTWRLQGAEQMPGGVDLAEAVGRLSACRVLVQANVQVNVQAEVEVLREVPLPADVTGPVLLDLGLAHGGELRLQGRALRCAVDGPMRALPAMSC